MYWITTCISLGMYKYFHSNKHCYVTGFYTALFLAHFYHIHPMHHSSWMSILNTLSKHIIIVRKNKSWVVEHTFSTLAKYTEHMFLHYVYITEIYGLLLITLWDQCFIPSPQIHVQCMVYTLYVQTYRFTSNERLLSENSSLDSAGAYKTLQMYFSCSS